MSGSILSDREREVLEAISRLAYGNPFGTDRPRWEREVLGEAFTPIGVVWHAGADRTDTNPNIARITERSGELADALRERLARERRAPPRDLELYRDLSLRERLADSPGELSDLVLFLVQRMVGEELAEEVAGEVESWIRERLGPGYPWPGNVRELAQCVNNVLIRREYQPAEEAGAGGARERLLDDLGAGRLSAEEALGRYCTLVYAQSGSYEEAARRLGLDRRTVRARVDADLLRELRGEGL